MADMMSTLRGILGDGADEKIQTAMNMLKSSGLLENQAVHNAPEAAPKASPAPVQADGGNSAPSMLTPEGVQFLTQIKGMVDQVTNSNDSRSNLLRSLRPFMREDRQRSIDRAIRIMNIGKFSGLFRR